MDPVQTRARVGPAGILHLSLPLGEGSAGSEVLVTIQPVPHVGGNGSEADDWRRFVERTAGSIQDPTFNRPAQGEFDRRDELP